MKETNRHACPICGAELEVVFRETQYDVALEIAAYEEARVSDPKPFLILTYSSQICNFVKNLNNLVPSHFIDSL